MSSNIHTTGRMRTLASVTVATLLIIAASPPAAAETKAGQAADKAPTRMNLRDGWSIKSSALVKDEDETVSKAGYRADQWYPATLPCTVLNALVRNKVYPDPRLGLNDMLIPDASDEFNKAHDLAKFSYLPDKRNPWADPYWYRTEFKLPAECKGKRVWLSFNGINYRLDVWLNGRRIADREEVVGAFARYRFDITDHARPGEINCLAVKAYLVDHPGVPDTQFEVFGKDRKFRKENLKDVSLVMALGYDCMPTVRDRILGLWQDVTLEFTGPVDVRHPFVVTDLPLSQTGPARLTVSAEVANATGATQKGVLRGKIAESGAVFEKQVLLGPGESRLIVFRPEDNSHLVIAEPRLWWPHNYGPQHLYNLALSFQIGGQVSDVETVSFGIRTVTRKLHELNGAHGLQLHVNGQKIFCRGGYIQPEILYDWDAQRMEDEVRYLTGANLNLVYFEDVPNPPDEFLDACDRHGLMFGNCFYGCYWMQPDSGYPEDITLLERGTIDILKRYRNHPSMVMYMAMNEGETREDVYEMWRKHVLELDGTRFFIPSGSFPDYRTGIAEWFKKDLPTGMNDYPPKSYGWQEPVIYYRWVRENDKNNWMFMMESGSASLPPIESLRRFIPDLETTTTGAPFPLTTTWAHHGANHYYKPYDEALRALHGEPVSVADYCMKGHLVTADQHRAMFEAATHRMWDITSGFTQWKVNACWPSVQWQIYDWFLRPMISYYYIKNACEPLHVLWSPLDGMITVVNHNLTPRRDLEAHARVYDFEMKLRWEKKAKVSVDANTYKDVFDIPEIADLTPVFFIRLDLTDGKGATVSRNFYWLSSKTPADLRPLAKLPPVTLKTSHHLETQGDQTTLRVTLENVTDRLAFFLRVVATKGLKGDEILPVFWEDNYFSLLPGETREVAATFRTRDAEGKTPVVEVGGWNVRGVSN